MIRLINADAIIGLKQIPDEFISCVMTSPPYWALRNYGVEGQIGLENCFGDYIWKLCDIFDEVKRVLRKDGTCWVNIGDTYSGGGSGQKDTGKLGYPSEVVCGTGNKPSSKTELTNKCLCMIPFRFALEMVNRGWILRNTIIWHKPNCMPHSIKDRFTVDFEYLFFFTKSKNYWFDQQFEPFSESFKERVKYNFGGNKTDIGGNKLGYVRGDKSHILNNPGRNKRCVWSIVTKCCHDSHFASYPEELCETPLRAGCPKEICKKCGNPREKNSDCGCGTGFEPGIVLDPFVGTGTTLVVAKRLGFNGIGIDINPEYIKIAENRLIKVENRLTTFLSK